MTEPRGRPGPAEHRPSIELRIERLVLDGLPLDANQAPLVRAAMEAELGRLLVARGLATELRAGGALPTLPAGTLNVTRGNDPTSLGTGIARAVYGSLAGPQPLT